MSEEIEKQETPEQEQEQPDAITLLAERLGMIEAALGVGNSKPSESNLLKRLSAIEVSLTKTERERSLPKEITWSEASSRKFLLAHGITLEDISSNRIQIVPDKAGN